MHFSIKLKNPTASFSIPYFTNVSIIIQNNKYQEITIAKIDKKNYPAGRSHGLLCNSLIIRFLLNSIVETQPLFGHVSTPHFITN